MTRDTRFLDAHCVLGRHCHWRPPQAVTAAELLDVMDHYGIAGALVTDCLSREADAPAGNRRVVELVRDQPRLLPAWVLLPSTTGETPSGSGLVAQLRAAGVKAVFLCMGTYRHGLEDWELDDVLGPLAEAHVPVFLNGEDGYGGWEDGCGADALDIDAVVRMAARHPTLPIVMTAFRFRRSCRRLWRALESADNIYLELSGYWFFRPIEFLCQHVPPQRLLFGTRLPVFDPAATKATVQYAEIPADSLRLIAGENLSRLLSWDGPAWPDLRPTAASPTDRLHETALRGGDLAGQGFMDCHGHLGQYHHYHVPHGSPEELVREMDRLGVEAVCLFSLAGVSSDDAYGNDLVIEAQRRYPDRFVGFVFPGPRRPVGHFCAEIERGLAAGLRGIKLYTYDESLLEAACRIAHRERLIVLNHDWGPQAHVLALARRYPNACFIQGHTSMRYVDVARQVDNFYICTCPLIAFGDVERYVEAYGAERMLFGSDISDLPVQWGLGPVLYGRIGEAEKRAVLGGNLRRLLETHSRPRMPAG